MSTPNNTQETGDLLKKVIAHAKEYGFIYPSSEVYEGLQAVYDYGPYGTTLKNNLKQIWWQSMTQLHENIVGLDAAIFMHPLTWKASGHLDHFSDPMIDNKDSKKRYRADALIETQAASLQQAGKEEEAQALLEAMHRLIAQDDLKGLHALILEAGITCPVSGSARWTEVRQFNLMFSTQVGAVEEESQKLYLRPETAQGIFVNFPQVQKSTRMQLPFGIAQIGKAFRNEIVARQFIFRMREFEQMEMQYFVRPEEAHQWFEYWTKVRLQFHKALGIPEEHLQVHPHENLAHYAQAAADITYAFPFGDKEIEGIHSRTDFDLKNHQTLSKKNFKYFDEKHKESYVPYVIETSLGCDRLVLMLLCHAYCEEHTVENDKQKTRTYLRLHPAVAPVKAAVLPLVKKDGLREKAREVFHGLKLDFKTVYEESQSIGKRYARQDLIGTPFCITVDHQTLADNTVTLRHRDSTQQERMPLDLVATTINKATAIESISKAIDAEAGCIPEPC